jgi:transcriptional regulator with XRE-family HTH domain
MSELVSWLAEQLDGRGWSYSELARRADLTGAAISVVMREKQNAGPTFCRRVAEALGVPPEKVFRLAGLLPDEPEQDEVVEELLFHFQRMTPEAQEHFRRIARALAEK